MAKVFFPWNRPSPSGSATTPFRPPQTSLPEIYRVDPLLLKSFTTLTATPRWWEPIAHRWRGMPHDNILHAMEEIETLPVGEHRAVFEKIRDLGKRHPKAAQRLLSCLWERSDARGRAFIIEELVLRTPSLLERRLFDRIVESWTTQAMPPEEHIRIYTTLVKISEAPLPPQPIAQFYVGLVRQVLKGFAANDPQFPFLPDSLRARVRGQFMASRPLPAKSLPG